MPKKLEESSGPEKASCIVAPPNWSHNWIRNFQRLRDFTAAVCEVCIISENNYTLLRKMMIQNIEDEHIRDTLSPLVCNLGLVLEWIDNGIKLVNRCEHVPERCMLTTFVLNVHRKVWEEHIWHECNTDALSELYEICQKFIIEIDEKVDLFTSECELDYSSYSDYSESSSDSDEEEEEEEDEDEDEDENSDDQSDSRHSKRRERRRH